LSSKNVESKEGGTKGKNERMGEGSKKERKKESK
jgi:hypothetical protein